MLGIFPTLCPLNKDSPREIKQPHLKPSKMKRILTLASIAATAFTLSNCATKPAPGGACCAGGASPGKACCASKPGACPMPCCAKKH